jgi:hypothetical protein
VALDGDQRAALEFFGLLFQDEQYIFANAGGADIVKPELDDAGQRRAALKQELGEMRSWVRTTARFSLAHRMIAASGALGGPSSRQ